MHLQIFQFHPSLKSLEEKVYKIYKFSRDYVFDIQCCILNGYVYLIPVIEIDAETSIGDAVKILSESNILSVPVKNPVAKNSLDWRERYLGVLDYSAIVLWVLEGAETAAAAISASSAAAAGVGAGTAGALGALALGATGPAAVAGLTVAAVGAAVAGGVAADRGAGKDAPTAANNLGEDFYKVILQEEPFKSTKVGMPSKGLN